MALDLLAILTDATCGAGCWEAREKVCRCSCGGRNHGCMIDPDGSIPERIVKIDGARYRLEAVGGYNAMNNLGHKMNLSLGWRRIDSKTTYTDGSPYHYGHYTNDKGAAVRVMTPARNQKDWPETKVDPSIKNPYFLWVRTQLPEPLWCKDPACHRCIDRKFEIWDTEDV